jgi:hypothetical protein
LIFNKLYYSTATTQFLLPIYIRIENQLSTNGIDYRIPSTTNTGTIVTTKTTDWLHVNSIDVNNTHAVTGSNYAIPTSITANGSYVKYTVLPNNIYPAIITNTSSVIVYGSIPSIQADDNTYLYARIMLPMDNSVDISFANISAYIS